MMAEGPAAAAPVSASVSAAATTPPAAPALATVPAAEAAPLRPAPTAAAFPIVSAPLAFAVAATAGLTAGYLPADLGALDLLFNGVWQWIGDTGDVLTDHSL